MQWVRWRQCYNRCVLLLLLSLWLNSAIAAAVFSDTNSQLLLDPHVEFALSDSTQRPENAKWIDDVSQLDRLPHHFLHFRVNIQSTLPSPQPVWFSVGFPALKTLVVRYENDQWHTGDALPFSSREVSVPNYHFPLLLPSNGNATIEGYMQGEILRYTFMLGTPEYFSNMYAQTLQRDMTFFGAMTLLSVLAFIVFIASRKKVFLSFTAFILAITFWFYRVFGYAFEHLYPNHPEFHDLTYAISIYGVLMSSFWVLLASLSKRNHRVFGATTIKWLCFLLPIAGVFTWKFMGLDMALRLPVLALVPLMLIASVVIIVEHKRGSDTAKWLAGAMFPVSLSTLILIVVTLFEVNYPFDLVTTFMFGVAITCVFMVVFTAHYLVGVVQRERDAQKQTAELKAQQTEKLEVLVRERTRALEEMNAKLTELASTDALTKLPNRRTIDLFIDNSFLPSSPSCIAIFIALLDLDHFKNINDTLGHDVGDIVLQAVAKVLSPLNSPYQVAGRFGGEEFAIIRRIEDKKPECGQLEDAKQAFAQLLNRVHKEINLIEIDELDNRKLGSCIGWATCSDANYIIETFRRADNALYTAKDNGRNLIVSAD